MKNGRISREGKSNGQETSMNQKSKNLMMKKKNRTRMGGGKNGGGLSLEAFASAKTKSDHYNPALIKKQREFYKTAKYVSKYKKSMKQQNQDRGDSSTMSFAEDRSENEKMNEGKRMKKKKTSGYSLKEVYDKKREEDDQARMEREAIIRAKKEETEKAQSRRKALKEKMFKKTRSGQPVMKYRIEHLLETIQGSSKD